MTERQLQDQILELAKRMGWLSYHVHDSRRSAPGFPDLVIVHPRQRRILWRELKSETGTLRPEQKVWISALKQADADADIWRPRDWVSGRIESELRGR
ncbi:MULTISPECIES: VRR-NUC domain-containing protein [unclassified Brevibacterium]|uniref:VRR-NUC domain-containing protein n=1 Tax=unclassified Brevibacterium TaxID=2614124 RepID=UPI001E3A7C7B|nr:VRR-NUC domain-containing protein [Brevibacterium sp. CCUG 69071]MCD1286499.1 VRR-NUC domain-containing protein [Brevibacterium sp. CCUG 69071]